MGAAVGVGLNYVVGGGVFIATGSVINMWNGPFWDVSMIQMALVA